MSQKTRLLLVVLIVAACGRQPSTAVPNSCKPEVQDLLIDAAPLPPGWSASIPFRQEGHHGATSRCAISFYVRGGGAGEDIYGYESDEEATAAFQEHLDYWFRTRSIDTPWEVPSGLSLQSLGAEEFVLSCSTQGGVPMCRYLARYGQHIVLFNTHMSPDFMTQDDLGRILYAIDEKMVQSP